MIYFGNVRRLLQFYSFFYYISYKTFSLYPFKNSLLNETCNYFVCQRVIAKSCILCKILGQIVRDQIKTFFARSDQNYQDLAGEFSTRVEKKNLLQVRRLETSLKFFSFQPPMFLVAALLNRTTP